ncbi:MAG: NAD(P)/FAD-dependent oxidoreductase [Candidatus Accumulibacter sp.]|nr:NAD(P)/FAD-dependent oxidoreductase [Accumulibacter sp.]
MKNVDVLIVGAGPAGLGAALSAHDFGLSVLVVDENPRAGGQIYRALQENPARGLGRILGADYLAGKPLLERFAASGVAHLPRARVWQIGHDNVAYLSALSPGPRPEPVKARFIVLATGAQERPFPLPGWTIPGAMTVGGAQILLKTAGLLPPDDTVLIGGGPLLYQFAWQIFQAGSRIQAIVDTRGPIASRPLFGHAISALRAPALLWRGMKLLAAPRRHGARRVRGAAAIRISGESRVDSVHYSLQGVEHTLETSAVLLHAGLMPEINFSSALGCAHFWNRQQHAWQAHCSIWRESSRPGLFIAGDAGGIAGAEAARLSGSIAALEIARQAGKIGAPERDERARPLFRRWRQQLAPRPFLDALYPPPPECFSPPDETIVCRCENVTAGEIRRAARLGASGPNQIKALTRAGMGPCQGRFCACVTAALAAQAAGLGLGEVAMPRGRFPLKPVTLEEIALSDADGLDV